MGLLLGFHMSKLLSKGSMTSGFITLPMKRMDPRRKQNENNGYTSNPDTFTETNLFVKQSEFWGHNINS